MPFLAGIDVLQPGDTPSDRFTNFFVEMFFQGKFFLLFSFVFGWGFAVQMASAERRRTAFTPVFLRRLFGLLAIGVAHALLVFTGDILVLYACLGLVLLALRRCSMRQLMSIAAALVVVTAISLGFLAVIVFDSAVFDVAASSYLGTFPDTVEQRVTEWPYALGFILLFNGPAALGAFCVGLAAAKSGFFERGAPSYLAVKRRTPLLLAGAIVFNGGYALAIDGQLGDGVVSLLFFCGLAIGGPCLATLYLLTTVELVRRGLLAGFAPAGRMSLTAYIAEGVLAGLLFNGYGLAYYAQLDPLKCLGIAVGIYAIVHVLCSLWLKWRRQGPLEWVLRIVTKGI